MKLNRSVTMSAVVIVGLWPAEIGGTLDDARSIFLVPRHLVVVLFPECVGRSLRLRVKARRLARSAVLYERRPEGMVEMLSCSVDDCDVAIVEVDHIVPSRLRQLRLLEFGSWCGANASLTLKALAVDDVETSSRVLATVASSQVHAGEGKTALRLWTECLIPLATRSLTRDHVAVGGEPAAVVARVVMHVGRAFDRLLGLRRC